MKETHGMLSFDRGELLGVAGVVAAHLAGATIRPGLRVTTEEAGLISYNSIVVGGAILAAVREITKTSS